jgi:hypothetical protein
MKEYTPTRAFQSGGNFWDHQCQEIISQYMGRFLPPAHLGTGQDQGSVWFTNSDQCHHKLWKSQPVGNRRIPEQLIRELAGAWTKLKSVPAAPHNHPLNDPTPQFHARRLIDEFLLPDPDKNPELYRLSGPAWARELHILWGCEQRSNTSVSPLEAIRTLARNSELAIGDEQWTAKTHAAAGNQTGSADSRSKWPMLWWVLALLLLLGLSALLWHWFASKGAVPAPVQELANSVPVFKPPPGTYPEPIAVEITTPTPGTEIRFAIDSGGPADADAFVYTEPVVLVRDTTIKAAAFSGSRHGEIATGSFTISHGVADPFIPDDAPAQNILMVPPATNNPPVDPTPSVVVPATNSPPVDPTPPVVVPATNSPPVDPEYSEADIWFEPEAATGQGGWCFLDHKLIGPIGKYKKPVKAGVHEVRVVAWTDAGFVTDIQTLQLQLHGTATDVISANPFGSRVRLLSLSGKESAKQTSWRRTNSPPLSPGSEELNNVCQQAIGALKQAADDVSVKHPALPDELGGPRQLDAEQFEKIMAWLERANPARKPELDALKTRMQGRFGGKP